MSKKAVKKKRQSVPLPALHNTKPTAPHQLKDNRGKSFFREYWRQVTIISLLAFLLYLPSLNYDYVLDDTILIVQNKYTQEGISGIDDIFRYESFKGFFGDQNEMVEGGRYRPLSIATFAIEKSLTGGEAWFSHLVNILLYVLSGILLFRVLSMMFPVMSKSEKWFFHLAFIATLFFIVHPLHVEVVGNVKGRDEILAFLGEMGGLYFTFKFLGLKKTKYLVFSFLCFFAGILSKEGVITFLAIVPITAYFFTDASRSDKIKTVFPVLLATLVYLVMRMNAIGFLFSGAEITNIMNNPFYGLSFAEKTATIFLTLLLYLKLLIYPHPLTHDYYPYHIPVMNWGDFLPILSLILHLGLIFIAIKYFKRKSVWSYSIIFYLVTLSIVSNVFISIGTFMNERFLYHSSLGFCIAAAYFLTRKLPAGRQRQFLAMAFSMVILSAFTIKTFIRLPDWKDQETLDRSALKISKNSSRANFYFGRLLWDQNYMTLPPGTDPARKKAVLDSVKPYFDRALEILPTNSYANSMKAGVAAEYHKLNGDYAALIKSFEEVNTTGTYEKFVLEYLKYVNNIVPSRKDAQLLEAFYVRMIDYYNVVYKNTSLPGDYRNLLDAVRNRMVSLP